ncbi:MAG: hypothetical protein IJC32_06160 [Clostridia bacterium]|nr:hypothetical protein [Clostridia bacterium]
MNAVIYERIRGITVSEGKRYTTYGIVARALCGSEQNSVTVASVPDISTDMAEVDALVARCNRLALSPVHLNDVVEDFLLG